MKNLDLCWLQNTPRSQNFLLASNEWLMRVLMNWEFMSNVPSSFTQMHVGCEGRKWLYLEKSPYGAYPDLMF